MITVAQAPLDDKPSKTSTLTNNPLVNGLIGKIFKLRRERDLLKQERSDLLRHNETLRRQVEILRSTLVLTAKENHLMRKKVDQENDKTRI